MWLFNLICFVGCLTKSEDLPHSLFEGINSPTPFAYPACLIGVQAKRKCNNHLKLVKCRPTCRRCQIASLGCCRVKHPTHIYCSDSRSKCRGYHPEQLHQFHFGHPNITAWDIYSTTFADCYYCSFHTYII